jgi:hypothetical protein
MLPAIHTRRFAAATCLIACTSSRRGGSALVLGAIAIATTAFPAGAAPIQRPHKPTSLAVTATTSSLTLSWKAVPGAVAYDVYLDRRLQSRRRETSSYRLQSRRARLYTFAKLDCGTTHRLGVNAVYRTGKHSATASLLAHTRVCPAATTAPSTPAPAPVAPAPTTASTPATSPATSSSGTSSSTSSPAPAPQPAPTPPLVSGSAPQCSRSSLSSCPASYFNGPLGNNNLIPAKPGAFLIDEYGGESTSWAQVQAGVVQRQLDIGRKFDGVGFHYGGSQSWGGVYGMTDPAAFSPRVEQWIHDNGSFPVITWTPEYTISQMNSGAADAIWAKAANYFKTYGFPIMLRPFIEFDGPFNAYSAVPWPGNGNVNSCGAPFIAAWQRMVNIFKQNGASNVGFDWNPEEGVTRSCISVSYPGDAYVDWVGSDWYNVCLVGNTSQWCTPLHPGWAQFAELFNYTALGSSIVTQHNQWGPRKPFVVGETGSWYDANYPTYKGDWYRNIPAAARSMLYLRGIQFYDKDVTASEGALNNFRVDYPTSNSSVYAGFRQMAADPWLNTK